MVEVNLNIEPKDINFVKEFLKGQVLPVDLDDVLYQLALHKTQKNRENRVKVYNPNCAYEVGDMIFKEYPGSIPIGVKKYVEMDCGVVLKVEEVRTRHGLEEIKLRYEGTAIFRKYTDYLERQKIELLLPHKQAKPCQDIEYLPEASDPRKEQSPLLDKDFTSLRKKFLVAMNKEPKIALISHRLLLTANMKEIGTDVFDKIKAFLNETKKSETTEFLVENFVGKKSDDKEFDAYCFALNYRMKWDYKIDFQQTTHKGWGKWNLISVIYYLRKNSLISEENPLLGTVTYADKKNLSQKRKKFDESLFDGEKTRYHLTQREVFSGALKLKSGAYDIGEAIEIEAQDAQTKKNHVLYYYSDVNLLMGLSDVFESYKALQGMTLSLEEKADNQFQFTIRTTKKGTIADTIVYHSESGTFQLGEDKIASPIFVNKSIFLESEVFKKVDEGIEGLRNIDTFNKLVHKIFLDFGIKEKNYEIHILRLYHILDLIYPTDLRLVQEVILSNPEFIPSEKFAGVFYLDSDAVLEIEEEEQQRREVLLAEVKQKRELVRQEKLKVEQKLQDEVRQRREEHRTRREQEMRLKEKKEEMDKRTRQERVRKVAAPRRKTGDAAFKAPIQPLPEVVSEKAAPKREPAKKTRRQVDVEKPLISKKKAEKKPLDEKLDIEEIKDEIKFEEMKEKALETKTKKKKKRDEVAYEDSPGFGGILASKLDEVVKKDAGKAKKKPAKETKEK